MANSSKNYLPQTIRNEFIKMVEEKPGRHNQFQVHYYPQRNTTIDCFEAAHKYGGFMICEVQPKKYHVNRKFNY
ncbi:unnamed protein product [Amaranthus hypochondriacus]